MDTTDTNLSERIETLEDKLAEVLAQSSTNALLLQQLVNQIAAAGPPVAPPNPIITTPIPSVPKVHTLKPAPPNEFSGDRSKGRAFLNSCELYIRLAPQQFADDNTMVHWVLTYMKSGRAALFADRVLRSEQRTGVQRYSTWVDFRKVFIAEFCPKNEVQLALAKLETPNYYQGRRSVDEYVDEFRELVDQAGYKEGLAIVVKFRRGLQREIQDQIAHLPIGRPGDDDPDGWYDAAVRCDENRIANSLFHATPRQPQSRPLTMVQIPTGVGSSRTSGPPQVNPFWQKPAAPNVRPSVPQNPTPMDIDAAKRKAATPVVCYRCGGAGHVRNNCPQQYDIRFMTSDEKEEFLQGWALQTDVEEVQLKAVEREGTPEEEERDFRRNSE